MNEEQFVLPFSTRGQGRTVTHVYQIYSLIVSGPPADSAVPLCAVAFQDVDIRAE